MSRLALSLALAALLLPAGALLAADNDTRWETTVKMTMTQPMQMAMPEFTSDACGPADPLGEPPPMEDGECSFEQLSRSATRMDYRVTCDMEHGNMVGEGWAEKVDADNYKGHMKMHGDAGGMAMAMEMDYANRRAGPCAEG